MLVALLQMGLIKEDLTGRAEHRERASVGQFVMQGHESNCKMLLLCGTV
jgi:hypothetical protein